MNKARPTNQRTSPPPLEPKETRVNCTHASTNKCLAGSQPPTPYNAAGKSHQADISHQTCLPSISVPTDPLWKAVSSTRTCTRLATSRRERLTSSFSFFVLPFPA